MLPGNIRQGPCGFVPACHCDSSPVKGLNGYSANRKELNYTDIKESQLMLSEQMAELKMAANRNKVGQLKIKHGFLFCSQHESCRLKFYFS